MATPIHFDRDDEQIPPTPAAASDPTDPGDRERSPRRERNLLVALVGLAVAVVAVGLAFPALLAPAVAVAVLVAIVALDVVLPMGELRQIPRRYWTR
jgi:Flp pilus assembly protein TadB